jgi:hypothetical protein
MIFEDPHVKKKKKKKKIGQCKSICQCREALRWEDQKVQQTWHKYPLPYYQLFFMLFHASLFLDLNWNRIWPRP